MENKKQSSIEWLIRQMSLEDVCKYSNKLAEAKEKHKQEIMDGYLDGFEDGEDSTHDKPKYKSAEQYYNLNFKNQENGKV
jgi:hypothetical protein